LHPLNECSHIDTGHMNQYSCMHCFMVIKIHQPVFVWIAGSLRMES
jgi:hypothetical protein